MQSTNESSVGEVIRTISDLIMFARGEGNFNVPAVSNNGPSNRNSLSTYSYSSAAKAASKLIAVFPVLTSRNVSGDTAQKIARYIEQKGSIIIMLALQQANISDAKNGIEYLRKFHQNLNVGGDGIDAVSQAVETWADMFDLEGDTGTGMHESALHKFDDSAIFESDDSITIPAWEVKSLLEMFKNNENIHVYDTQMNPVSIDQIAESFDGQGDLRMVLEARNKENKQKKRDLEHRDELAGERIGSMLYDTYDDEYEARKEELRQQGYSDYKNRRREQELAKEREQHDQELRDRDRRHDQELRDRDRRHAQDLENARRESYKKGKSDKDEEEILTRRNSFRSTSYVDQEKYFKKINDAVPSLLLVRFYSDSSARVVTEFIIGIKAKVISCNTDEILRRIVNDNKDGKFFFNLMRTMTGELRASEFLFGLSRIDEDLRSTKKKGAHGDTWKMLQNRAMAAKAAVRGGKLNNFAAITTVVISKEDANMLYRAENIDITNPKVAKRFMESYNLLGFIIVDDATESVLIKMDDGNNYFEELTYKSFEREGGSSEFKKLLNLISSSR